MSRVPLFLRALVLLPLLAAGVDHLRVSAFCPSGTSTCLEAAGSGVLGPLGLAVLGLYAAVLAAAVGRLSRSPSSFGRLWLTGSGGLVAVCAGQAALAAALGQGAAGGSGWVQLLPLVLAAGALLALALRAAPAALRLMRRLRPRAPRMRAGEVRVRHERPAPTAALSRVATLVAASRAPPLTSS